MNNKLALSEVMTLGECLAKSGYFNDAKQASQAVVKVLAGQELGIGPIAAMSGISIIKGKPEISSNILASLVKSSTKYDCKIVEHSDQICNIEFFENGTSIGFSDFSMDNAKQAGLDKQDTYKKFPRNMLFNRAMSNGVKWFCPDITNGQVVYTPGEIKPKPEPEFDLVIEPSINKISVDEDRQRWIESTMLHQDYPSKESPAEKVGFINQQLISQDFDFAPVTIPEVL
jgi:hypothetical protein